MRMGIRSMTLKFGPNITVDFDPALLGCGLFYAALAMVIGLDGTFARAISAPVMMPFLRAFLIGVSLGSILLVCLYMAARSRCETMAHSVRARTTFALVGTLLMTVGACCLTPVLHTAAQTSTALLPCGGALFGVGAAIALLSWGTLFVNLLPQDTLFHVTLALTVGTLVYVLTDRFLPVALILPMFCVLIVISTIPLLMAARRLVLPSAEEEVHVTMRAASSSFWKILWKPLFGALIAAFIVGLIWNPVPSQETTIRLTKTVWRFFTGPAIAAVCVLGFLYRSPKQFALHTIQEVFLPLSILLLMVIPFIDKSNLRVMMVTDVINEFAFAIVILVTCTSIAAAVRTTGLAPQVVIPTSFALLALATLLGTFVIVPLGTTCKNICLIITAIYLIVLLLSYALEDRDISDRREVQRDMVERYLQERCAELSKRYGLSSREQEVLLYLSRGYSQVYIARELYISENTIRTHTRHIYTKMGVDSREQLLQLIDADER